MRARVLLGAAAFVASACAHVTRFEPSPEAEKVPGHPGAAEAEVSGVILIARPGLWKGMPSEVEDELTPVRVAVENHSGKTIVVTPEQFELVGPEGVGHAPLPPDEAERALAAAYARAHYWYYDGWYSWYPAAAGLYVNWGWGFGFGWPDWPGPFFGFYGAWPPPYAYPYAYDYPYAYPYRPPPPPSGGREKPSETKLPDGGRASRALFFRVPASSLSRLELRFALVDADTNASFGTIRLPFVKEGTRSASRTPPGGAAAPPPA